MRMKNLRFSWKWIPVLVVLLLILAGVLLWVSREKPTGNENSTGGESSQVEDAVLPEVDLDDDAVESAGENESETTADGGQTDDVSEQRDDTVLPEINLEDDDVEVPEDTPEQGNSDETPEQGNGEQTEDDADSSDGSIHFPKLPIN